MRTALLILFLTATGLTQENLFLDAQLGVQVHHCQRYALPEGGVDLAACFADPTTVDGYVPPLVLAEGGAGWPAEENAQAIPEPISLALVGLGLLALKLKR